MCRLGARKEQDAARAVGRAGRQALSTSVTDSQGPGNERGERRQALPPRHRDRHAHARHGRRPADHLGRLRHLQRHPQARRGPVRRLVPDAAQSLDPAGADLLDRGDDHRHGADHRHAPDRSFGRLDARASSPCPLAYHAGLLARARCSASAIRRSGSSPCCSGIAIGAAIGCFNGILIAYASIPSFIVTLGGLIVWRGAAWWVIRGETVAPDGQDLQADRRQSAHSAPSA